MGDDEMVTCWQCDDLTNKEDAEYRSGMCYDCWWNSLDSYDQAWHNGDESA